MDMEDLNLLPSNYRATLTTRSGATFTGVVHSVQESSGKIVLKNVTTAGSKLYGPQIFYQSDLINLQYLSLPPETCNQNRSATDKKECVENVIPNNPVMDNVFGEDGEKTDNEVFGSGEDGSVAADSNGYYRGEHYILISGLCDMFYDAIVYIMEQKVVGVTFKGVNIGRDGTLSVIQVATDTELFIFDILTLGKQAFGDGLQALFEAKNIVKVIHDCRWISDMLYHKYDIGLANVFDTQVANAFVHKILHNGYWPHYVESLPNCLVKHLNLPVGTVQCNVKNDPSLWLRRPLSANLLSEESKGTRHLIKLYKVLINKLLYEFKMGVEIYLSHIRVLPDQGESDKINGCHLPNTFLEIPKLVNNCFADSREGYATKNCKKDDQDRLLNISDQTILCNVDQADLGSVLRSHNRSGSYGTDKPAEKGSSNCSNGYRNDYNNKNSGRNSHLNNIKVSENIDCKQNKDQLQDGLRCRNEEINSDNQRTDKALLSQVNNDRKQNKDQLQDGLRCRNEEINSDNQRTDKALLSQTKERISPSHMVANKSHIVYRQAENNLEITSSTGVPVSTFSDKGTYKNCFVKPDLVNTGKSSSTDRVTTAGKPADENVLASEMNTASSVKPGLDSDISRSKLWRAIHSKQNLPLPELLLERNTSEENSNEHVSPKSSSHERCATQKQFLNNITSDRIAFKQLSDNCVSNSDKSRNSSFENNEVISSPGTPTLLDHSPSFSTPVNYNYLSGVTESRLAPNVSRDNVQEARLDISSFMPAGYNQGTATRKKRRSFQEMLKSNDNEDFNETNCLPALHMKDDISCIPMQVSLKRLHEYPLGASFGIGDPFSESECSIQQSENPPILTESQPGLSDESGDEDTEIEDTHQLEVLQKALKMTPLSVSGHLQQKLLPPKTPPSSG